MKLPRARKNATVIRGWSRKKTYAIARDQIQDDHIALLGLGSIDNVYKGYVFHSALEVPTKQ